MHVIFVHDFTKQALILMLTGSFAKTSSVYKFPTMHIALEQHVK